MLLPLLGIELRFFGNPAHSPLDELTVISRLHMGYAFIGINWRFMKKFK